MDKRDSLSIDGWQIDADSYRISRDGVDKKLEPRSMELLIYLADRSDQVVTRQEIEEKVWKGRIVGSDVLSGSIVKIRKAFEDTSKNSRIIETIPKSGYRLIATVLVEREEDHTYSDNLATESFERKLTAIFYADVAGYSRLSGEDEDRTHRQLRENMKTISDEIIRFHGRIVHYAGDAVLADFSTASTALHCALDVQNKVSKFNSHLADNQQVLFRIGVNLGEVIVDGDEIYGDGVNVAARLESLADPGGVCISGTVFDAIGQKQNFEFEYQGEKTVKNIHRPIPTYAVHLKSGITVPPPETPQFQLSQPGKYSFKTIPITALAILIVVIGLVIMGYFALNPGDTRNTVETPDKHFDLENPSLAILPFRNISNDPEQSIYSDGLTNDLITDLSNVDDLIVTPRHLSFAYAATKLSLIDVAMELRVRYILVGSIRRSLGDIRVDVQLVDTQSDQEIWAARFDDSIEHIFKLQDQIISQILEKMNLEPGEKPRSRRRTTNLEAYDYFLRAEYRRLNRRVSSGDSKSAQYYRRAIELDPLFVAAYTGLARVALSNWQNDETRAMPSAVWKKLVYEAAGNALELDPDNAEALAILGLLQVASGAYDVGIALVKNAVTINPANPQLHSDLSTVLSYGGAHQEALQSINTAIYQYTIPPSAYIVNRGYIYFFLGQFENALKDAKSDPDYRGSIYLSILVYGALNDRKSAKPYVEANLNWYPMDNQEFFRIWFATYRRPQDIELIFDSATKAGVPRFAYGFDPGDRTPLDDISISVLINKGLWQGTTHSGSDFFQQFSAENSVAIRTSDSMRSGAYHIEGNKLCVTYRSVLLDLPDCGYIYPEADNHGYTWVTLGDVYQFTVGP